MADLKTISVFSGKLNKNIELEVYPIATDDKAIVTVTANSLKRAFESIKNEFGITDSVKSETHVNEAGEVTYTSVEWTLKDKSGYNSTFIGEATLSSLTTDIAKQYPKVMAYNRALSLGIKMYLQLDLEVYSDDEIFPGAKTDTIDNKSRYKNKIMQKLANSENRQGKADTKITAAKALAGSITEAPQFKEPCEDIYMFDETQSSLDVHENQTDSTLPDSMTDGNPVNDNSVIPIGVFAGQTVKKLFEADTIMSKTFIQMCALHQIKDADEDKMKVLEYIAEKAKGVK